MENGSSLPSQLRRGVIEHCVLALLAQEERYGFDLVKTLGSADGITAAEGTVYPLLSRLKRGGYVTTTWRESEAGPPRKYYAITTKGQQALEGFAEEWGRFRDAVDALLEKGSRS